MKVIKPIRLDEEFRAGLFILVPETGIDLELLEALKKKFGKEVEYEYIKTSHAEVYIK